MIRQELLAILACPYCDSPRLSFCPEDDPAVVCRQCGHRYRFENNIPLLYKDDAFWAPKKREAAGWVAMWKDMGLYDQKPQIDLNLPFVSTEPWATVGRMFDAALSQMDLRGGERILDIGAGEGWASQHFTQRGSHAVAIDVVADTRLGLGRAWERMAGTRTTFDLLIGDNERLPFQPNTFDFVFSSNTLHHSDHLDRLMPNIFRVLRPGGRLIAIGDPLTTIFQQESDMQDAEREKSHGIIERRRRFYDYFFQIWRAGFRNIHFEDEQTVRKTNVELYPWMDRESYAIVQNRLFGTTATTKLLAWAMLRLPRPFALAMLLSLRNQSLLLISGQKPL